MGALKIKDINIKNFKMPEVERKYLYAAGAISGILILVLLIWFISLERLPGYNIEPTLKGSYIEPGGVNSEYFTGFVKQTEISIKGPKMTVTMDINNSDRTFFVPYNAPVWLGLIIGDDSVTGNEKIKFTDLKKGWRVAVFIGPANNARRVNVIKRIDAND
jgi:hypothetical protein